MKVFILLILFSFVSVFSQDFEGVKKINETGIYCKVIGKGEPVIIVHGGPGMAHNYLVKPFLQLAENYKLFFYDQRGCGLSDEFKSKDSITMETMVEDLEALRKEFGLAKINLAGQSWGAAIAINYAAKYPDNVKKLMLLEPLPISSKYIPVFIKNILGRFTKEEREEYNFLSKNPLVKTDPVLYKKLNNLSFKHYYYDTAKQDLNRMDYMDSVRLKKQFMSSGMFGPYLNNYDLSDKLKTITCPILIIHGDYDVVPNESILKMKEANAAAELHIIEKCGHFVHVEKEKEYFDLINKFLK